MSETLLGILAALFGGLNIFQFIFFRYTKKEYWARAEQAAIEAKDARFEFLQKQINDMEALYKKQGDELNAVREELLRVSKDKLESDKKVAQLEMEKKTLEEKVDRLAREVEAYKTISGK